MSSNLMDTEIGGEQTQYEAEYSDVKPHAKEAGQLGGMSPNVSQRHFSQLCKTVSNAVHRPGPRHLRDTAQEGHQRAQHARHHGRRQDTIWAEHPGGRYGRKDDFVDGASQQ